MTGLKAIDVLLLPDEPAQARARELNARLRDDLGQGFEFDDSHLPHVTLLQRYVPDEDLERVCDAVAGVEEVIGAAGLRLRPDGLTSAGLGTPPGVALVSVVFEPDEQILWLHEAMLATVAPFGTGGGSPGAFFTLPGEPPAGPATVAYVDRFVPEHSGEHYEPHMSLGLAREPLAERLRDDPLIRFEFRPVALAVCRLGDLGTARQVLRRWAVHA